MNIVVIGAGLAGASAVEELRTQGYADRIVLLGAEPHPPYERPPLSKGVLLGTSEPQSTLVHDRNWYADHQVDLLTDTAAESIDLDRGRVRAGGEEIGYDRLLLATGATPRRLPLAESSGVGVAYLRTLDDAIALKDRLHGRVVVIGAGWIGLEVAAAATQAGAQVTVVEPAPLPLLSALGPEVAEVFADLHRRHGVDLRLGTSVELLAQTVEGTLVGLSDGHRVAADLVVVGIGVEPDTRLARTAGLAVDNGILTDQTLRTSDPHVFAAGDVANHDHPGLGRRIRVEHWDCAVGQGRHAARAMLGDDSPYARLPYFFTDQYDLGMEYVGALPAGGYDEVVLRGGLDERRLSAIWLAAGRVEAAMHVNDWDSIDTLRALVGRSPGPEVRDRDVPLSDLRT